MLLYIFFFFFNDTATTEIYTLSLHDALPIREDAGGILIRVHDSGPGIDPGLVEEIFTDGFTTKVATGVGRRGLGLALVSGAVQRRRGTVKVENADGARFTVFLPHVAAPTEPVLT